MPSFSKSSASKLATCHPDIQKVFNKVIEYMDCTVLEGVRDIETQKQYVATGKSKTLNSRHLMQSDGYSHAVDVMPYPIDWADTQRIKEFSQFVKGVAAGMGVKLKWGGDWRSFYDGPHYQLGE